MDCFNGLDAILDASRKNNLKDDIYTLKANCEKILYCFVKIELYTCIKESVCNKSLIVIHHNK